MAKFTRREILRTGGLLAATVVAASCTPKSPAVDPTAAPTTASGEPAAPPAPQEKATVRMAFWDAWMLDAYEHEAKLFNELFPNLTVAIEMTSWGEYSQKLATSIAGGVAPDVVGVIGPHFLTLASKGSLKDIAPFIERDEFDIDDYLQGNLKQSMWMGVLHGIPLTADAVWWFYNVDGFREAGLKTPTEYWKEGKWDWNTYLDLADKLTKGEGLDKQWGTENIAVTHDYKFHPMIWSNGGELFNADYTECLLDEEKAVQAFEFAYECRKFAPTPEDEQSGTAESGRLMMWGQFEQRNTLYVDNVPFEYSVAPPPASPNTGETMFCGDAPSWALTTIAKHPDAGWEWIKFLSTPDSLSRLFQAVASPPPRISMLADSDTFHKLENYPNPDLCYEITQARMKAFRNDPKMSNWAEAQTAKAEVMSLVWVDEMGLHEGIKDVARQWDQLLKEAVFDPDVD